MSSKQIYQEDDGMLGWSKLATEKIFSLPLITRWAGGFDTDFNEILAKGWIHSLKNGEMPKIA